MLNKKITHLVVSFIAIFLTVAFFNPQLRASPEEKSTAHYLAKPGLLPTTVKSTPLDKRAGQDEAAPSRNLPASECPSDPLNPEALDPPESCAVQQRAAFGADNELLFVDPTGLYQLEHPAVWQAQSSLPGLAGYGHAVARPESEISAVASNREEIFAVWLESGQAAVPKDAVHAIWTETGSWAPVTEAFIFQQEDAGRPVALALGSKLGFFQRQGSGIFCKDYSQAGWTGHWLPGLVENAAPVSNPAVIAKDPEHVAVFYRSGDGGVWLTERLGSESVDGELLCAGGRWRKDPVSLSGATLIKKNALYLPLISSAGSTSVGQVLYKAAAAASSDRPEAAAAFTLASELSAASRNANHMAVFGVNAQKELWVKEWTHLHESDWRDTQWVRLMTNVEIERPSVISRHMNHLAVAVRDATSHQAYYIEWSSKNGWKDPVPLGQGLSGNIASPLTLSATAKDAMSLFTVEQGAISLRSWTEKTGWQPWEALPSTPVADPQALTAVVRKPNDVMLLGKDQAGSGMMKHFTSLSEPLTQNPLDMPAPNIANDYRGQTLARVDGEALLATPDMTQSVDHWQVDFRSLVDGDTYTHDLPGHAGKVNGLSDRDMAAGDVDSDGSDELVFVSTPQISNQWQMEISVLNIEISPTLTVNTLASTTFSMDPYNGFTEQSSVWDVNVAIGDLDGDGIEDEIAVAFYPHCDVEIICWVNRHVVVNLFEIEIDPDTGTMQLADRGKNVLSDLVLGCKVYKNGYGFQGWCQTEDLELAIGKVVETDPKEQLIISNYLFRAFINNGDKFDEESFIELYRVSDGSLDQETWEIVRKNWPADWWSSPMLFNLMPWRDPNPGEIITLEASDIDADGVDELIHLGDGNGATTLFVIEFVGEGYEHTVASHRLETFIYYPSRTAVGDLNQDGIEEIAILFNPELSSQTTISVYELRGSQLQAVGHFQFPRSYVANILIGDLDNNSFIADLVGCAQIGEVSIVAVLNGAPRWYRDGEPIHAMETAYAKTSTAGYEDKDGTHSSIGASLSIGMEVETSIPFGGPTFGVRASVQNEIMATMGCSSSRTESSTRTNGFEYQDSPSTGRVIFNTFLYRCNYYDLYAPDTPEKKTRAMACQPTGCFPESCQETELSLSEWHSPCFKAFAGDSWVNLGHLSPTGTVTNLVTTYPDKLPIDPETLKLEKRDPIAVIRDQNPSFAYWELEEATGGAEENTRSFENNTTISAGMTVGYVTTDVSTTVGFGGEESQITSWEDSLAIKSGVENFRDSGFKCYDTVPYLYHAKARTLGGTSYQYLALDWYVPRIYPCPY